MLGPKFLEWPTLISFMNYCQTNQVQILVMPLIFERPWATLDDVSEMLPALLIWGISIYLTG